MEDEELHEACGVFACITNGECQNPIDVANIICVGLVGLQHRGQESAGIVTTDGQPGHPFHRHKGMGLVSQVFTDPAISKLQGYLGIGHNRYSTAGSSELTNCQPFVVETIHGLVAVAHNGELVNANSVRHRVLKHGIGLSTKSDTELIAQLICQNHFDKESDGPDWVARIRHMMSETPISYSIVMMHHDTIYAFRDPYGNRPLCIGELTSAKSNSTGGQESAVVDGWVVSSESCSFQPIGVRYYREVLPGEIVKLTRTGVKSMCVVPRPHAEQTSAYCIFEYVYFARADSVMEGQMVYSVRRRCGRQLAREAPAEADVVSTIPESATPAAFGYAEESGIPYMEVLCKNRYIGRTFIQPSNRLRRIGVAKKFGALADNVQGKRVVLLDDSIVRGNTMGPIVRLLKNAGAKEVHVRVASPPIKHPCFMGINIPTSEELVANQMTPEVLAEYVGADSLKYLSIEGLVQSVQSGIQDVKENKVGHCTACLSGSYPVDLEW